MSLHVFDPPAFRVQCPEFSDPLIYPDVQLQVYWDLATAYIDPNDSCLASGSRLQIMLNWMTAHLKKLSLIIAKNPNKTPGLVQSATIDKVTVSLTPPPLKSQFQWWLSLTPYGQDLFALIQRMTAGGYYFGGLPEGKGFQKIGGVF